MTASPAAGMPGEALADRLATNAVDLASVYILAAHRNNAGFHDALCQKFNAILAPILAEKERDNRQLKLEVAEKEATSRISIYAWRDKANEMEARALAAEAALAAERERCAKVAEDHGMLVSNEPIGKACSRNIAAAIRAQGE